MKRVIVGVSSLLVISSIVVGCGQSSSPTTAKSTDASSTANTATNKSDASKQDSQNSNNSNNSSDIWTYYNNATWSDNYNGLKLDIEKVVVSDKGPHVENGSIVDGKYDSYVGVKFKIVNTTQNKFTTYPDQAVLVTSTGEQIDNPELGGTDHIGGEIDEGVTKEGNIVWKLQRGHAADITWIKLKWDTHQGPESDLTADTKTYEIKIPLK